MQDYVDKSVVYEAMTNVLIMRSSTVRVVAKYLSNTKRKHLVRMEIEYRGIVFRRIMSQIFQRFYRGSSKEVMEKKN